MTLIMLHYIVPETLLSCDYVVSIVLSTFTYNNSARVRSVRARSLVVNDLS